VEYPERCVGERGDGRMIHFVVTGAGSFSIRGYLADQARSLADRMRVVLYDELTQMRRLRLGTWVFTDSDQLDEPHRDLAELVRDQLGAEGSSVRLMNDPRQVRMRLELLDEAHRAGANDHRAWRATEVNLQAYARLNAGRENAISADSLRYPVFVRYADRHAGALTPLLDSPRSLADAVAWLVAGGASHHELAVVEFCDTQDAKGIYRKYAAYNVGGTIMPRSLECSREWMVKWRGRIFDRERADEELRYCEANPHEAWIGEMFRLARIDYGRIDYAVQAGVPRLWEINTNPTIARGPHNDLSDAAQVVAYRRMVASARAVFHERFQNAWVAVDTPAGEGASVELQIPGTLTRAIDRAAKQRRNAERVGALVNVVARQTWVRPVTRAVKRALAPIMAARLRNGSP
jgi:hypothetical protein